MPSWKIAEKISAKYLMYRIGIGYDLHRLIKGRRLILGGINIPFPKGLSGHSDADVLSHAVCDALLGAAGLKDIGEHFPDSDPAYRGISSIKLLKKVTALLSRAKFSVCNIDTTVVAEQPNLAAFKAKISQKIAQSLGLSAAQVNVKATTTEGTGPTGRGQAISAYAIAMIKK